VRIGSSWTAQYLPDGQENPPLMGWCYELHGIQRLTPATAADHRAPDFEAIFSARKRD